SPLFSGSTYFFEYEPGGPLKPLFGLSGWDTDPPAAGERFLGSSGGTKLTPLFSRSVSITPLFSGSTQLSPLFSGSTYFFEYEPGSLKPLFGLSGIWLEWGNKASSLKSTLQACRLSTNPCLSENSQWKKISKPCSAFASTSRRTESVATRPPSRVETSAFSTSEGASAST